MSDLKPFVCGTEQGRAVWHMGALVVFRATAQDTGGQFWLQEQWCNQGYGSPLHLHTKEDELFHVLEGELSIEVNGELFSVPAGSSAFGPRGLPHSYKVESETAHFLVFGTPAGFENWFFETGKPAERLEVPEFNIADFPDFGDVIASLAKYGGQVLGPPRD
jgi:quercetin dioxygenase-like cupin family protein